MRRMSLGRVCVVCGSDVIARLTLLCSFAVMSGRMLVMFGGAVMVLGGRMRMVHGILSQLLKRKRQQ